MAEIAHAPVLTIDSGVTAGEAARRMGEARVGSLIVTEAGSPVGILTKSDLARRVLAEGRGPSTPLAGLYSRPLVSIQSGSSLFEALMEMIRHGIGHLAVFEGPRLAGVISEHDWLLVQERHPAALFRSMAKADSIAELAALRAKAISLAGDWFRDEGSALALTRLLTEINDRVSRRALDLALAESERERKRPARFAWLALGSEGRGEQTLATDQDNGILFEDVDTAERDSTQRWFLDLAARAVEALERCGFPRCAGNVMATNPELCQTLEGWKAGFARIIAEPEPAAVLQAAIRFDFRCVYGDAALADALRSWLVERAARDRGFLGHLAAGMMLRRPPVTHWRWRLNARLWASGRVDLKAEAAMPVVHGARVLALGGRIAATHTVERLEQAQAQGLIPPGLGESVRAAYEHLSLLRLRTQLDRQARGEPAGNGFDLAALDPLRRRFLLDALATVRDFQDYVSSAHGGLLPS